MKDSITNEPTQEQGLDNWYGGPKKIGIRDILVGLTFIAIIVLSIVIYGAVKEMKQQSHINSQVTCPSCGEVFIPKK